MIQKYSVNIRVKIWFFDVHRVMKLVVVAKILQEALHGSLVPPTRFVTRWTSRNQILILKWRSVPHAVLTVIRYTISFFEKEALLLSWKCQHRIIDCILIIWKDGLGFSSLNVSSLKLIKVNLINFSELSKHFSKASRQKLLALCKGQ